MSRLHIVPYQNKEKIVEDFYSSYYLDEPKLIERCFQSIDSFRSEGEVVDTPDGIYIYKDNNAPILAVAHLDTVISDKTWSRTGKKLYIPQLDDRLGVHCLLDVLPKYGLVYDLLLTEGEEMGRSTAKHFVLPEGKSYNWMFEIDRSGDDAVMYQYETAEYRDLLRGAGFKVGIGSFTDITYLSKLGCLGINFGCAYYNNHSVDAWLDIEELHDQLDKIIPFIRDNYSTKHEWDYSKSESRYYSYYDDEFGYDSFYSTRATRTYYNTSYTTKCKYCMAIIGLSSKSCWSCGLTLQEPEEDRCEICESKTCFGLEICELCGFEYHNNEFVSAFDFCADCLVTVGVPFALLQDYEAAITFEDVDAVADRIRSIIE